MKVVSPRKPKWLKVKLPGGDTHHHIKQNLRSKKLFTVCEEARCPNLGECWSAGTATLMILGEVCTRGCRFCAVRSGNPGGWIDPLEPAKCAETVATMKLNYVVITCVDRDDLEDGGAGHFAAVIRAIRKGRPDCLIEVLTSDYQGRKEDLAKISLAAPDVFAHNIETVRRLTPRVRDKRASYDQSMQVLATIKELEPERITKSSIMLGLGETREEIIQTLMDLREHKVDVVTLGQYLRPSRKHLAVEAFIPPEDFDAYGDIAREMGFLYVASGPLVRSSYRAGEYFMANHLAKKKALALREALEV